MGKKTDIEPTRAPLITVGEIEKTLRMGHTKVAELIRTGELGSLKIGKRRFTTPEMLNDFVERKIAESHKAA